MLLCIFIAKRTNGESTDNEHPILIASGDEVSCSVYLAKSSIPNAGWGVFAGQDFSAGEQIVRRECDLRCLVFERKYSLTPIL